MQFFIGDDEDDDDEPAGYDNGEPVAIDSTVHGGSQADSRKATDDETAQAENIPNGESGEPAKAAEPPTELVEVKHKVARGDTLMSIARKYASDVSISPFSSPSSLVGMMERPSLYLATAHRLPHHRSGLD